MFYPFPFFPPPSPLSPEHFHSYDFADVWGGTREEATEKVMAFFESSHFQVRKRKGGKERGRREGGREEGKKDSKSKATSITLVFNR